VAWRAYVHSKGWSLCEKNRIPVVKAGIHYLKNECCVVANQMLTHVAKF